jgi:hypothetical protein
VTRRHALVASVAFIMCATLPMAIELSYRLKLQIKPKLR